MSFTADDYQIPSGTTTILRWNVSGTVTSCTASGGWTGTKASAGSETITPPSSVETSYTLACLGPNGTTTQTKSVQAIDPPQITSFTETPNPKTATQKPTFNWTSVNA